MNEVDGLVVCRDTHGKGVAENGIQVQLQIELCSSDRALFNLETVGNEG